MLTKATLKGLDFYYKNAKIFHSIPFKWDSKNQKLHSIRNKCAFSIYLLNMFFFVINGVNTNICFIQGFYTDDYARIAIDFLFAMGYISLITLAVGAFRKRREFAEFVTQLMEFNVIMTAKIFKRPYPVKKDGCAELIWLFASSPYSVPACVAVLFMVNPNHPRYIYHHLPEEWKIFPVTILWLFYECYCYVSIVLVFNFFANTIITSTISINFWQKILLELDQRPSKLQYDRELALKYKEQLWGGVRMLDLMSNLSLETWGWPTMVSLVIVFQAYNIYATIKLHGIISPYIYGMYPIMSTSGFIMIVTMFPLVGTINYLSTEYISSCRKRVTSGYDKRKCRAMRQLGARVGSVYMIKRTTWLTMVLIVSNLTINAVLLH
ncbi:unnamed protein product [Allacma fusca]|uniref:Uncharacterized protein n=1 Tax=Allacma fusca TaxID=39272 RepID=A0A8J2P9H9_9HEXA|nr:unnamed protein product [Allacma fusca]